MTLRLTLIAFIIFTLSSLNAYSAELSEVAIGTLSCSAQWNEFCEDQKTIHVPDAHTLCKHTITVKEQTGDSSYELISADAKGIIVKFHAKGNRDRFKQQSASIILNIILFGVRDESECPGSSTQQKPAIKPEALSEPKPPAVAEIKTDTNTAAPAVASPAVPIPKPHACACSKWIDADRVTNCLVNGRARDNVTCDSFAVAIQCVATKDECRELQKEDCFQVMGLNQSTSQKRIFVADSPYCHKP